MKNAAEEDQEESNAAKEDQEEDQEDFSNTKKVSCF